MVSATSYIRRAGPGGSGAFLADCDDGRLRVIKLSGNHQGDRVLVNELVAGRLLGAIGAPVPSVAVVHVPDPVARDAAREIAEVSGGRAGLAFGSLFHSATYAPSGDICRRAANRDELVLLAGGYQWVRNFDLKDSHLMWITNADGTHDLLGLDHGHCIGTPDWSSGQLAKWTANPHTLRKSPLDDAIDAEDVARFESQMSTMDKTTIRSAIGDIPSAWKVDPSEVGALVIALRDSCTQAVDAIRVRYP